MRAPDVKIRGDYLHRWFLIPRNKYFNIYLHKFMESDEQNLHDHPWHSVSFLLKGKLLETYIPHGNRYVYRTREPKRFIPVFRHAELLHRLEVKDAPVWTLFITGPIIRRWGFWVRGKWVDSTTYLGD